MTHICRWLLPTKAEAKKATGSAGADICCKLARRIHSCFQKLPALQAAEYRKHRYISDPGSHVDFRCMNGVGFFSSCVQVDPGVLFHREVGTSAVSHDTDINLATLAWGSTGIADVLEHVP